MTEKNVTGAKIYVKDGVDLDAALGIIRAQEGVGGQISASALKVGVLTVIPECLTREHLGRKVRFQRIAADGYAKVTAVLESIELNGNGYRLVLDSGTILWGSYDDGATVQFL